MEILSMVIGRGLSTHLRIVHHACESPPDLPDMIELTTAEIADEKSPIWPQRNLYAMLFDYWTSNEPAVFRPYTWHGHSIWRLLMLSKTSKI